MKELLRKFDDAKTRISKLKLYKDLMEKGAAKLKKITGSPKKSPNPKNGAGGYSSDETSPK